jgi:hypothetical protein
MAFKKLCYTSPLNRAEYDPIIDEIYYPNAKDELEKTISLLFETSHRLLTGTLLKCRMRYFASKIFDLIKLLANLDGIGISVPNLRLYEYKAQNKDFMLSLKLLPIFNKIVFTIYQSTIVVDETFSLMFTIKALQKTSKDLAERIEQEALKNIPHKFKTDFEISGKLLADEFLKLYPRFRSVSERIEDFTSLIPLYAFNIDIPELPFLSENKKDAIKNWQLKEKAYSYYLLKNTTINPLIRCYLFLSAIENNPEIGIWKWGVNKFANYMSSKLHDFGNTFYFNKEQESCIADRIIERWNSHEQEAKELNMGGFLVGKIMKYTCCASNIGLNEKGQIGFYKKFNAPVFIRNEDVSKIAISDSFFQSPIFEEDKFYSWGQELYLLNSLYNQLAWGGGLECPFRHPKKCPLQLCSIQSVLSEIWKKTRPLKRFKEKWAPDPCIKL